MTTDLAERSVSKKYGVFCGDLFVCKLLWIASGLKALAMTVNDTTNLYFEGLKKFVLKNKEAITQMYNPKDLFDVNTYNILDKDPSQFKRLLENTIERIVNSFNFRIFLDKDQSVLLNRYISGNHKNTRDLIIKDDNCEQKSGYNQDL